MEPLPFALALCCLLAVVAVLTAVAAVVLAVWRRPNVYQTQGDRYITAPIDDLPQDDDLAEIEREVRREAEEEARREAGEVPSAEAVEPWDDDGEGWKKDVPDAGREP